MGRKKRGRVEEPSDVVPDTSVEEAPVAKQVKLEAIAQNDPFPEPTAPVIAPATASAPVAAAVVVEDDRKKGTAPAASGYGLHAHSGDMVEEDVYISDGSEDEADMVAEVVLAGSRMGVMRRGLHHPLLVQPTRQWKREEAAVSEAVEDSAAVPQEEDDALAQLDPAQRAARLLQEKQRKLQEAKETARRMESEENAGRDPCLFSKRTAFDIRMDQIEDKPWIRGDVTDFFNYTLTEEDWMDYSTQQLAIRQELTDAGRQRRPPDPTIVPVMPRAPAKQTPKVAVSGDSDENGTDVAMGDDEEPVIGPAMPHGGTAVDVGTVKTEETEQAKDLQHLGSGGAWGAGAAPGSLLARLIEEQENGGALPTAPVAESSRPYEEVEPYHEPEQHYGRSHDARETYDNSYDRYGGQQQQYQGGGYSGRGGYGGRGGGGGDYEGRPFGGPPPPFGGRGGRGGPPPPFGGRGGRGRGGGYGGEDAYSRKRGHEDYYGGGGWR
jgi:hypothetical protein